MQLLCGQFWLCIRCRVVNRRETDTNCRKCDDTRTSILSTAPADELQALETQTQHTLYGRNLVRLLDVARLTQLIVVPLSLGWYSLCLCVACVQVSLAGRAQRIGLGSSVEIGQPGYAEAVRAQLGAFAFHPSSQYLEAKVDGAILAFDGWLALKTEGRLRFHLAQHVKDLPLHIPTSGLYR